MEELDSVDLKCKKDFILAKHAFNPSLQKKKEKKLTFDSGQT